MKTLKKIDAVRYKKDMDPHKIYTYDEDLKLYVAIGTTKEKVKRAHSKYYAATTEEFMKILAEGGFVPIKYKDCNCHGSTEHWINPECDVINLLPSRQRASKTADFVYTYYKYDPEKSINNAGYHLINIGFSALLHRVMAYTFLGNPREEQRDINHIDGNKNNNLVSNLEWCTHKENMLKYFNKEV